MTLLLGKIKPITPKTGKRRKIDGKGKLLIAEDYLKSNENLQNKLKKQKKVETKSRKQKQKLTARKPDSDTNIGEEEIPYDDDSDLKMLVYQH